MIARTLAAMAALAAPALPLHAQGVVTYFWDVNDTGSNVITIGPGETVRLRMSVLMEPEATGFAGSIYGIVGLENWDSGAVTRYENLLDDLTGPGDLQANNDIVGIEAFQLPPVFNIYFRSNNPLALYEIEWTPDDYSARTVRLTDADHLNNDVYVDDFGTSVAYDQNPSQGVTIHIVPAPSSALLLTIGLALGRRRA